MNTELELGERLTDAAAAAPDQLGVSVEELRRRGTRRQRTRIAVTAAAVLVVTAGALVGVSGVGTGSAGDDGLTTVGAPPTASPSPEPVQGDEAGDPAIQPTATIDTGESFDGGTLTFWFAVRQNQFLQAVGRRTPDGKLSLYGVTNDPDTGTVPGDPGFHAGWEFGSGQDRFLTGYVVGDAAKVTLTVDGTPREAKTAAWAGNPTVHVWWVRAPEVPGAPYQQAQVRDLTAFDPTGKTLATHKEGGVGVG
ncbi:hypothetical protein AB0J72_33360 [Dactylosporangium sp. NPDC049742]|uniref:hypothetical protein n=1 Tax=Dactylosporangium sp. NPDC049742 TaxID=3154737 RepID=UPI00343A113C